jgi:hypothetical protein
MSQRQIAMGIAQSIRFRKSPTLSEGRRKILEEVADEVRALMLKKKDLAVSMIDVVNFGFTAMVLRWPKTQVTLARALFLEAEVQDNNNNFRTKAACVLAQMPEKSDHNEDKKIMAPA